MRPIHIVTLDKDRPCVIVTREVVQPFVDRLTVIPIQSQARGIVSEVKVGPRNGLDHDSVANLDNITTARRFQVGRLVGFLLQDQEDDLARAFVAAFDLDV
jgi:mRNA interferase MazF